MSLKKIKQALQPIRQMFAKDHDRFLRNASGVVHVGANSGQERGLYAELDLRVVWVEPIPGVFEELKSNIAGFPKQQAIQALVTDQDNKAYDFHISNNQGASSSILDLKDHRDIWPTVEYTETISIESKTLVTLLREHEIDPSSFDVLIMDTQGTELLVLKGSESILRHFEFIKTEVADFESYAGCCRLEDIDKFLAKHGFSRFDCHTLVRRSGGGKYYDVTYRRES